MLLFNLFRQPYLDADSGTGGGTGGDPAPNPNPVPPSDPAPTDPPAQDPAPNPTPSDPVPTDPAPFLKIKYNKDEVPLTMEEAQTLAQKGMNYEKAVERARQEARDSLIASHGYEWNGKPITTEAEYHQALREKEIYDSLQDKGLPDEVVRELAESRKFRQQLESERTVKSAEEKRNADFLSFLETYPGVKPEEIPPAVWDEVNRGGSLVDSYRAHENTILRQKVSKLEETLQIRQKNDQNAQTSPGSVTGNGSVPIGYYSEEQVRSMDPKEAAKPEVYKAIMESMKSWKKS